MREDEQLGYFLTLEFTVDRCHTLDHANGIKECFQFVFLLQIPKKNYSKTDVVHFLKKNKDLVTHLNCFPFSDKKGKETPNDNALLCIEKAGIDVWIFAGIWHEIKILYRRGTRSKKSFWSEQKHSSTILSLLRRMYRQR